MLAVPADDSMTHAACGDWSACGTYLFLTLCAACVGFAHVWEMSFTYVQLFVAFLLSAIGYRLLQGRQRRRIPFPPGPKGHSLIGNLRDLPTRYQWLKYEEWGKDFGTPLIARSIHCCGNSSAMLRV
jgi:hypothetical protein